MTSTINDELNKIDGTISAAQEKILLEPYTYIAQVPVTDAWTKIAKAHNYWLKVSPDKMKVIIENCEMFNNASLLLDDIQDDQETRKGIPTAHCTFGMPNALNAYYYASAISSSTILDLNHPQAVRLYKEQLMEVCRARRMVVYWRDTVTCPTEEDYEKMLIKRSSSLITITIKLLQLFSEFDKDILKLSELFGLYINILEDYERLKLNTDPDSKSYAEDITRGHFTFPVIHAINNHPEEGETIMEILRKRTKDVELKKYVLSLLERFGSYTYTENKLKEIKKQIIAEVQRIGKNPQMDEVIKTCLTI